MLRLVDRDLKGLVDTETSPEVRAHLGAAGASLMQAAAGLLAGADRPPRPDETQQPGTTGPEEDRT